MHLEWLNDYIFLVFHFKGKKSKTVETLADR